jgi:hypothetical protein
LEAQSGSPVNIDESKLRKKKAWNIISTFLSDPTALGWDSDAITAVRKAE